MNHIIVIWLMTAPGVWEATPEVFDTYKECHAAIHVLRDAYPEPKPWHRFHEYLLYDGGTGMMYIDKCRG